MDRTIWSNNNDGSVRQRVCFWKGCEYASKNKDPSTVFSPNIFLLHWHTIAVLEMIFPYQLPGVNLNDWQIWMIS